MKNPIRPILRRHDKAFFFFMTMIIATIAIFGIRWYIGKPVSQGAQALDKAANDNNSAVKEIKAILREELGKFKAEYQEGKEKFKAEYQKVKEDIGTAKKNLEKVEQSITTWTQPEASSIIRAGIAVGVGVGIGVAVVAGVAVAIHRLKNSMS